MNVATWALFACWILIGIYGNLNPEAGAVTWSVQFFVLMIYTVVHGGRRYGLRNAGVLAGIAFIAAMVFEAISIQTGFPFGYFYHTDAFGPKVLEVPWLVGVAYVGNTYLAWIVATIILNKADIDRGLVGMVGLPFIAALITAALDATYDPGGSTAGKLWFFRDPGGYFGVPMSNYGGWFFTTYFILQTFALFQRNQEVPTDPATSWWIQPPVLLLIYGLQQPLNLILLPGIDVQDPSGQIWNTGDLFETTTLFSLSSVCAFSLIALLLLVRRKEHHS